MSIGKKIRHYRLYKGYTQDKIADSAKINEKYYGRIEREESVPTITIVQKIVDALGINFIELLLLDTEVSDDNFKINERISEVILHNFKQGVDTHFNREVVLAGCEKSVWYSGYIGSISFDEFELKLFAQGNIRANLYINYNELLELNDGDISSELFKYIKSDRDLDNVIEYMSYDKEILDEKGGNALFVSEINWLSVSVMNNNTGEILVEDDDIGKDNIIDVLKDYEMLFDYIF